VVLYFSDALGVLDNLFFLLPLFFLGGDPSAKSPDPGVLSTSSFVPLFVRSVVVLRVVVLPSSPFFRVSQPFTGWQPGLKCVGLVEFWSLPVSDQG